MKIRVFCAIEIPLNIRLEAARRIELLRQTAPRAQASWERAEKIHITLRFLGDVEEGQLSSINKSIETVASSSQSFELSIEGTGAFPPRAQTPRVLWLGVKDDSGSLMRVQQKLEEEFAAIGFQKETRAFHPHLTLARLRSPEGAKDLREEHERLGFKSETFTVKEILIMRSELLPAGSLYTILLRHALII